MNNKLVMPGFGLGTFEVSEPQTHCIFLFISVCPTDDDLTTLSLTTAMTAKYINCMRPFRKHVFSILFFFMPD